MYKEKVFLGIFLLMLIPTSYADNLEAVMTAVERICKAPSDKTSSHYKITATGEAKVKVNIVGITGDAEFEKEEWSGVQRVLREHQSDDNKSYRKCAIEIAPIFIEKYYKAKEVAKKVEIKKTTLEKDDRTKSDSNGSGNSTSFGDKSPVITNSSGPITISY